MKKGKRIIEKNTKVKRKMSYEEQEKKKKIIVRTFIIIVALIVLFVIAMIANNYIILDNNERTNLNPATGNYSATRTSTDATLMGMNATAWTWLILGLAAIAIVALVWYYSMQVTSSNYKDKE